MIDHIPAQVRGGDDRWRHQPATGNLLKVAASHALFAPCGSATTGRSKIHSDQPATGIHCAKNSPPDPNDMVRGVSSVVQPVVLWVPSGATE